ncbi:TPA: hypothetical protein ACKQCD_004369 [Stenotrophomonas maltophilia]|jgi:hypothetical protein
MAWLAEGPAGYRAADITRVGHGADLPAGATVDRLAGPAALPEVPATELLWQTVGTLLILGGGVALALWIPRQRLPAVEDVR